MRRIVATCSTCLSEIVPQERAIDAKLYPDLNLTLCFCNWACLSKFLEWKRREPGFYAYLWEVKNPKANV